MKKIIALCGFCILFVSLFFIMPEKKASSSENILKADKNASSILFNYGIEEIAYDLKIDKKDVFKTLQTSSLSQEYTTAYSYDIDNDGQKEIIGTINSTYHCGFLDCAFYILKKKNAKYVNLGLEVLVPRTFELAALGTQTDGYMDFKIIDCEGRSVSEIKYDKQNNRYHYTKTVVNEKKLPKFLKEMLKN